MYILSCHAHFDGLHVIHYHSSSINKLTDICLNMDKFLNMEQFNRITRRIELISGIQREKKPYQSVWAAFCSFVWALRVQLVVFFTASYIFDLHVFLWWSTLLLGILCRRRSTILYFTFVPKMKILSSKFYLTYPLTDPSAPSRFYYWLFYSGFADVSSLCGIMPAHSGFCFGFLFTIELKYAYA